VPKQRPDPDQLLAKFEAQQTRAARGSLKILFGALGRGWQDLHHAGRVGELLARVRAVLRRKVGSAEDGLSVFRFGDVEVDLTKRLVCKRNAEVQLTVLEYRLLSTVIRNAGRVLAHRQILHQVWGPSYEERGHYVRIHMGHLRRKLEDDATQQNIC